MSIHYFVAHAGHDHTETASGMHPELLIGGGALVAALVIWLLTFRLRLATRVILISTLLLATGIVGFQAAPITSVIAISTGMAFILLSTLVQLAATKHEAHDQPRK